jgi:hypothetical protein
MQEQFDLHFKEHFNLNIQEELMAAEPYLSDAFRLLDRLACNEHLPNTQESAVDLFGLSLIVRFGWWERMWVVQETLLSPDAYVVIGKAMLPWKTVFRAAVNFVTHATTCCQDIKSTKPQERYAIYIEKNMKTITQVILSFQRVPTGTKNELLANLWMFRNRLASLAHDKVYGTLGMITAGEVNIKPDYGKTFSELCRSVIVEDIRINGNLHALRGTRVELDGSLLTSSWDTDWNTLDYWAEDQARIITELYKQLYCASGTVRARVTYDPDPYYGSCHRLGVAGNLLDRVVYTTSTLQLRQDLVCFLASTWLEELQGLLRKLQEVNSGSYVASGSTFSAFWRTLLGDCVLPEREYQDFFYNRHSAGQFEPSIRRTRPSDLLAFLLWTLGGRWGFDLEQRTRTRVFDLTASLKPRTRGDQIARQLANIPAVVNINASIVRATSGRRMFITSRGYVGLGPELTREGDQVAILLGGTTPFMIRRGPEDVDFEQQYRLLGDCYVHGCMDGEFVKDKETDEWATIVLV